MKANEIRKAFLDFFASKSHEVVSSAPMVIKNDPTLMFTNAGMNQFKDIFLGNNPAKFPRITNSQKCLRVSGKHNDLEEVGVDTYHHTMFEMLGNWSFGDYFKKEAISWAWELLTDVYKLDKDRLYVTIFEGDEKDGTAIDQEAYDFWKALISEDRIIKANKKDNFWEMGDVGPCGPCSEIHVDLRDTAERTAVDGKTLVNEDHPQVVEVWNLVFMEYTRMANGELKPLPAKHVDTGMGFERLAMALQGKKSNYDTDVFMPLINKIEEISSATKYTATDSLQDVGIRVIADHVRTIAFSITDGQLPSNTGAGYVIRRILRRAVRYGYSFLNQKEAFMYQLIPVLIQEMGNAYPELKKQQELITKVVKEEEDSFLRTLANGIKRFQGIVEKVDHIDGKVAFELYDTFGFPIDLTQLLASEQNKTVDMAGFESELQQQKDRARNATKIDTEDWVEVRTNEGVEFVGYDQTEAEVQISRYRKITAKGKDSYQLVFNTTPFYAEGGGQVGDTGFIEANGEKVSIVNTKKENNLTVHFAKLLPTDPSATFKAVVSVTKRNASCANHSATHLLHEALRDVLGTHVEQKGSLVNADYLRFDFSHFSKVTEEELATIENKVNEGIRANYLLVEKRSIPMQEAIDMGAMALFGEKYGDTVRAIKFGSSIELCGGTHVQSTGQIRLFKIKSEAAVASGIRRIEAISSDAAIAFLNDKAEVVKSVAGLLKNPKNLVKAVEDLQAQNAKLQKEIEALNKAKAQGLKQELLNGFVERNGINFLATKVDLDAKQIKDIAFQLKNEKDNVFAVFGSDVGGKANISVLVSENLVEEKGLDAGKIVRELAKEIQGGGGGQKFFASAGGKKPEGIAAALEKAESFL